MASFPPEVVHERPPVIMFTAPNPSPKTLDGTHTFVVGRRESYVIDPGPNIASYQQLLAAQLASHGHMIKGILLSHGHPDHAPGAAQLRELLGAPVWGSERLVESATGVTVDRRYADGERFSVDGDRLRVLATPGHSPDHVAFWLEGARILFAGDTILGQGTTLVAPPEGDMRRYMQSLEEMKRLRPRLIAPGHGPLILDPAGKIEEYVEHRRRREEQLLEALKQGPATAEELVSRVYTDIDPGLHALALGSVEAQLIKLEAEGRVRKAGVTYVGRECG